MGCLVVFSKRSYLGSCTLDYGTTVCNPNRGQRVAEGAKKTLVGLFAAFASTSPKPEVVQRAVRLCSVSLRGARLVSIDVFGSRLDLPVGQWVS